MPFLRGKTPRSNPQNPNWNLEIGHWSLKKGFTLIELLVVISIIAILIGAATVSYTLAQKKGRDAKRKSDLKAIQQALELFYQTNGQYPPLNYGGVWCATIFNGTYNELVLVGGASSLAPNYINPIPKDPKFGSTNQDYTYRRINANQYEMFAVLENSNDPDKTGSYSSCYPGPSHSNYNYKVTNP